MSLCVEGSRVAWLRLKGCYYGGMNTWYLYAYLSWSRSDGRARKQDPDPRVQETRSQTLGIIPFCPQALNPKTFWLTVSIKQHYSLFIARRSDPKLRKVTPKTKLEPSVIQDLQRADKSASVENTGICATALLHNYRCVRIDYPTRRQHYMVLGRDPAQLPTIVASFHSLRSLPQEAPCHKPTTPWIDTTGDAHNLALSTVRNAA